MNMNDDDNGDPGVVTKKWIEDKKEIHGDFSLIELKRIKEYREIKEDMFEKGKVDFDELQEVRDICQEAIRNSSGIPEV